MARIGTAAVAALLAVGVALCAPTGAAAARCPNAGQPPAALSDHELRTSVLCLVNQARLRHGLVALAFSPPLKQSATGHSKSMVRSGLLSHYGPRGSTLEVRVAHSGYLSRASDFRLAENLAAGRGRSNGSPVAVVREWMRSPGHRSNILDPALRDAGVGVARGAPPERRARNAATYTLDLGSRAD